MDKTAHLCSIVMALFVYADPALFHPLLFRIEEGKPCSSQAARQFDFWLGEWEVMANGRLAGINKISRAAGDCALLEEYQSQKDYAGKSLSFFNSELGKWQQVWVGSAGDILFLTGAYESGKMILQGESMQNEKKVQNRITWFDNHAAGTVRQLWESSEDAGATWKIVFDGLYQKKKSTNQR